MTAQADPYSRFYWRFIDEFPDIYDDKPTFGWWMTLLVMAEGAHPSSPHLPRSIPRKALDKLVEAQLVELGTGDRFRVRGVDAERARRSEAARVGGLARHRSPNAEQLLSKRSANGQRTVSLDETRLDEQRQDETRKERALGPMPVKGMDGAVVEVDVQSEIPTDLTRLQKLAEELTGVPYVMANVHGGLGKKAWQEQLLPHGYSRVERAWRGIHNRSFAEGSSPPTLRQLVLGADDILNPVPAGREMRRDMGREDENARFDRRVANTQRRLAAIRNEEPA